MKLLILSLLFMKSLIAYQQVVLITAADFNASKALMQRYEATDSTFYAVGDPISVNIGRNGLGWGNSPLPFDIEANEPQKYEGDGRAPSGIFEIQKVFGRAASLQTSMPYLKTSPDMICIDDSTAPLYNKLVILNGTITMKSFEWMQRDDGLYTIGILIGHNQDSVPKRGSCVFMHLERSEHSPTSGCTSMSKQDLQTLIEWLRPSGNPILIQIPKKYCSQITQHYPGVQCR